MNIKTRTALGLGLIVLSLLGCYGGEKLFKARGLENASLVTVQSDGQTIAILSTDVFVQLKKQEPLPGDDDNSLAGPPLSRVLAAAGVNAYRELEIIGLKGDRRLNASQVGDEIIFYFSSHNTVNLGQRSDGRIMLEDVSRINVSR